MGTSHVEPLSPMILERAGAAERSSQQYKNTGTMLAAVVVQQTCHAALTCETHLGGRPLDGVGVVRPTADQAVVCLQCDS
jgi:hypothetical protein